MLSSPQKDFTKIKISGVSLLIPDFFRRLVNSLLISGLSGRGRYFSPPLSLIAQPAGLPGTIFIREVHPYVSHGTETAGSLEG
jgi:hypothetical protein